MIDYCTPWCYGLGVATERELPVERHPKYVDIVRLLADNKNPQQVSEWVKKRGGPYISPLSIRTFCERRLTVAFRALAKQGNNLDSDHKQLAATCQVDFYQEKLDNYIRRVDNALAEIETSQAGKVAPNYGEMVDLLAQARELLITRGKFEGRYIDAPKQSVDVRNYVLSVPESERARYANGSVPNSAPAMTITIPGESPK